MLTLKQANAARQFQQSMDRKYANLFARALPDWNGDVDFDSVRAFEAWAFPHPDQRDALAFLHEALAPTRMVRALSAYPLERALCGH